MSPCPAPFKRGKLSANPWQQQSHEDDINHFANKKKRPKKTPDQKKWAPLLIQLINNFSQEVSHVKDIFLQEARITSLEKEVRYLKKEISALQNDSFCVIPINTFAPEPYLLKKELSLLLRNEGGEYIASFIDANLSFGGSSIPEAVENLKNYLLDVYDDLKNTKNAELGSDLLKQKKILSAYIQKK